MKNIIFGSDGMLGTYVQTYLRQHFDTVPLSRKDLDLAESPEKIKDFIINRLRIQNSDVIVNASGVIKQRSYNVKEMIMVNALFPHVLAEVSEQTGCRVIHITTDCVYSGLKGSYVETDEHDCVDEYGKTKSLGENKTLTVIRTSIIGEELKNKISLIEWFRSQNGKTVNGFTNHFWNGLTCLELAKFIQEIIETNNYWTGVKHVFSPETLSKFDLLNIIKEIYKLDIEIKPVAANLCNRSLASIYRLPVSKSLSQQIQEQANFSIK